MKIWFQNRRAREKRDNETKIRIRPKVKNPATSSIYTKPRTPEVQLFPNKSILSHYRTANVKYLENSDFQIYSQMISPLDLSEANSPRSNTQGIQTN